MLDRNGVLVDEELANFDWASADIRRLQHVIQIHGDSQHLTHSETGEILATASPGYKWFFVHEHPHLVPEDWTRDQIIAHRG